MLFSATLDGAVAVLTREYQNNAARHEVGAAEPDITLAEHRFWKVEPGDRVERTADLISAPARRSCSAAPVTVSTGS